MSSEHGSNNGSSPSMFDKNGCVFPDDCYYDIDHDIWIKPVDEYLSIGLTSILQAVAGKFVSIKPKSIGTEIIPGRSICTVESQKYVGALRSPIEGRIVQVNDELIKSPSLANTDPYGNGWVIRLQSNDDLEKVQQLTRGNKAIEALRMKVEEKRILCFKFIPDITINAIGLVCPGPVMRLAEEMTTVDMVDIVHLVADDPASDGDVQSWAKVNGVELLEKRSDQSILHFLLRKKNK